MEYYSTGDPLVRKNLHDAVLDGLAPDGGLYMPARIPRLSQEQIQAFRGKSLAGISGELAYAFFHEDLPPEVIAEITGAAISFDTPLVKVEEQVYSLELFHGPTLAFKDVGARFMARLLGYFTRDLNREINVLVATSGDTGSAVANGFRNVDGIRVFILFPRGGVSELQEMQLTTLGGNIIALEIDGTFDDCQRLVKRAFTDTGLTASNILTSANSINLARFLPQSFYYFHAYAQLPEPGEFYMSVPSGNFGNLTAGLIAGRMGLPVKKFMVATNINDVVPEYLRSGRFFPRPSQATIANAMDVGNPSNFVRILDLYGHSHEAIIKDMTGYSYTDDELKAAIKNVYETTGYMLDPHGAAGYNALTAHLKEETSLPGIFMETAHPAKFRDVIEEVTGVSVALPDRLQEATLKDSNRISLSVDYQELKDCLLSFI